jgi:hypothetical protein
MGRLKKESIEEKTTIESQVEKLPTQKDFDSEYWQWLNTQPDEPTNEQNELFYQLMTSSDDQIYNRLIDIITKRTMHPFTLARRGNTVTIDRKEGNNTIPFTASSSRLRPSIIKAASRLFFDVCIGKIRPDWKFARTLLKSIELLGADHFRLIFQVVRDNGMTEIVDSQGINLNAEIINLYATINDYPQSVEWWSNKHKQHGNQIKPALITQVKNGRKDLKIFLEDK